jgi:hypothetical protein
VCEWERQREKWKEIEEIIKDREKVGIRKEGIKRGRKRKLERFKEKERLGE